MSPQQPRQEADPLFNPADPAFIDFRALVAQRTQPLLVWVGSGVSLSAGAPSWFGLSRSLIDAGIEKAKSLHPTDRERKLATYAAIRNIKDLWLSFERLQTELGETTYRAVIRNEFAEIPRADVPLAYVRLWQLNAVRGVMTLNIDRLVTRAFTSVRQGAVEEATGHKVKNLLSLGAGQSFIGNLHGTIEDSDSWVFTQADLKRLTNSSGYQTFMKSALMTHASLFVGMSVDDVAIGGHLDALKAEGINPARSFWITDHSDSATDEWAEQRGLRIIRYTPDRTHSGLIQILDNVLAYTPPDYVEEPPVSSTSLVQEAGDVDEGDTLNALRQRLNAKAHQLLEQLGAEGYDKFLLEHDRDIHQAWYLSVKPPDNYLYAYRLDERVAKGGFGGVYRAIDTRTDEQVAVKVLLDEVRNDPGMLHSFRRGVRTMEILAQRDLPGMVRFREATEIPAFVSMEWIEGPNLEEARQLGIIVSWLDILTVSRRVCEIVLAAHRLPEQVLHRDLRPANIMLRDYWTARELDVVVLDFDLSWHKGATTNSIELKSSNGYLAPEQLVTRKRESSRNAAVDSFGLGMTFYFLVAGIQPLPSQHMFKDWANDVMTKVGHVGHSLWRSTPARFSRLIVGSTYDEQARRFDLSQILKELQLLEMVESGHQTSSFEHFVEEIMACSEVLGPFYAVGDASFTAGLPTGLRVTLSPQVIDSSLEVHVSWVSTGVENYSGLGKYMVKQKETAIARFGKRGWHVTSSSYSVQNVDICAVHPWVKGDQPAKIASALDDVLGLFSFDAHY